MKKGDTDYPYESGGEEEKEDADAAKSISGESQKSKLGRPLIPDQWTRVMNIDKFSFDRFHIFEIKIDLLLEGAMPDVPAKKRTESLWEPLFHPNE